MWEWVGILFLFGLIVFLFLWLGKKPKEDSSLILLQQQISSLHEHLSHILLDVTNKTGLEIDRLHQRIDERLKENVQLIQGTHKSVGDRIDRNTQIFGEIQNRLTSLEEATKRIESVGLDISDLQDILQAPKLRGNLGELLLENLLSQILPSKYYSMQYRFRTGEIVDAVVHLANRQLVPIDAKFPLENFRKMISSSVSENQQKEFKKTFGTDVKKHIDDVASRYIRPDENTLDFVLLYIPAENIYYEVILRDENFEEISSLNHYALKKRVIPVSPNSLYAYLQAISLGLKGLKIEERAKEILSILTRFRLELQKLGEDFDILGKHLFNASSTFDRTKKRLENAQNRISNLEESQSESESESQKQLPS